MIMLHKFMQTVYNIQLSKHMNRFILKCTYSLKEYFKEHRKTKNDCDGQNIQREAKTRCY